MKTKMLSVRIPDAARDELRAQAHARGLTMSEYAREILAKAGAK